MRVNIYSQEITPEVLRVIKKSNTGIEYEAIQFVLHSSAMLHSLPDDDDRSAVTFWLPKSERGLNELSTAFSNAGSIVDMKLQMLRRIKS
jgi:hypothetical protein